jgi:hypothetical protein
MTFRKLMMLAGIGGLVYAHRKRGGQMTLESFKQSGRDLFEGVKTRADEIRSQAEMKLHDTANKVADRTDVGAKDFGSASEEVSYGSSGYDFERNR